MFLLKAGTRLILCAMIVACTAVSPRSQQPSPDPIPTSGLSPRPAVSPSQPLVSPILTSTPTPLMTGSPSPSPSATSRRFRDGSAETALFHHPSGIAIDAQNNLYVADSLNHCIRKISPTGFVSTVAGNGSAGYLDGSGVEALFNKPVELVLDSKQNLYITDQGNHVIRKMTPNGVVTTYAGLGSAGFQDGPFQQARFNSPTGISVDNQSNIFVADSGNRRIRKITPSQEVSTLAGTGEAGFANGPYLTATFYSPHSLQIDKQGNLYVGDSDESVPNSSRIRKLTPFGEVQTINTKFSWLHDTGFSIDPNSTSTLYVNDTGHATVFKLDLLNLLQSDQKNSFFFPGNHISLIPGRGPNLGEPIEPIPGITDVAIPLKSPQGITADSTGNLFVTDTEFHLILKLSPNPNSPYVYYRVQSFAGMGMP